MSIQNMLTEKGNPRLQNLETILKALGLHLSVSGQVDVESPRPPRRSLARRTASG